MRLLLIRHGDMAGDPFCTPVPPVSGCLSERGKQQAEALSRRLASIPIDAALCSPYGRAIETAEIALRGRDIPLRIISGFQEWTPSEAFRTAASTEAEAMNARDAQRYAEETWKTELGEGFFDMAARVVPALLDALASFSWHHRCGGYVPEAGAEHITLAIFAHGGSLNTMMNFLLGLSPFPVGRFSFEKTAVAKISFTPRRGIFYPALEIE